MKKDYYEILGIAKEATVQEVKKAYRSKALKYHPDRVAPEKKKEAEERFKEISEAYGVLSDPQKRQMYDQHGHAGIDQRYTSEDIFKGADFGSIFGEGGLGDVFEQFFGGSSFGSTGGGSRQRARRGADIQYETELMLEEAFKGGNKKIKVPRHEMCDSCGGSGAKPGTKPKACHTCNGSGQVFMSSGFFRMAQTCPSCHGSAQVIEHPCQNCQGRGVVRVTRNIDVNIPAGVSSETRLRVRGEGEAGPAGSGDLYLYILVKPHEIFERDGNDLHVNLPVSFVTAALGGEMSVPTLNGKVSMAIPSGTQSGKVFRLRGKGMPDVHGGSQGDEYARVMVQVPNHLSAEQRKLLEEFARISGEDSQKHEDSFADKIKKVFK